MQTIAQPFRSRRQRGGPIRRSRRSETLAALGDASFSGVETLAQRSGQALPTLGAAPTSYNHEVHSELLYELCASLVRCGIGRPSHWKQSGASGNVFAQNAIREAITNERLELLARNLEYHLQVADVIEHYGDDRALEASELAVLITSGNCGYLEIGTALEALEGEERGLGAAFYWEFTSSLYRVMRLYNHDDAMMREEQLHEWADQEDEESREQCEFPEVEKALPECIRATLKEGRPRRWLFNRRLLLKHQNGKLGSWIRRLRRIQRLARLYPKSGRDLGDGYYDSSPLPTLLVVFKQHDAIAACFDEESQYMLESSPEPSLSVVFSPQNDAEVSRARKIVERFVLINCELFQLVEEIQKGWEKTHERRDVDRRELSLRAA
jgi:hypothetical protein